MSHLISVIVPVYNVAAYLPKCIESILAQTYKNLEIILIDDGSPDSCGDICEEYQKLDNRIYVVHKENGGLSEARNVGIELSKGEYITFIDSDDWVDFDFIECLYNALQSSNVSIALAPLKPCYLTPSSLNEKVVVQGIQRFSTLEMTQKILYTEGIAHEAQGKLYAKFCFETIRFPVGLLYEDLATTLYVLQTVNEIVYVPNAKYNYLIREDSIMHKKFDARNLDLIQIADKLEKELSTINSSYKMPALHMKMRSYCKSLQLLLCTEKETQALFEKEKKQICKTIKKDGVVLLLDGRTKLKDKVKICSLFLGERFFSRIYAFAILRKTI